MSFFNLIFDIIIEILYLHLIILYLIRKKFKKIFFKYDFMFLLGVFLVNFIFLSTISETRTNDEDVVDTDPMGESIERIQ